jgi:hypothetical protein
MCTAISQKMKKNQGCMFISKVIIEVFEDQIKLLRLFD